MRAVLVVNPNATTTTVRSRDILVRALRSQVHLDVVYTEHRGHGVEIARRAAVDGIDLVVTLGGDGTVNEVANGLVTWDGGPAADRAEDRPMMGVVSGGSTNVFARALGIPREWAEGTGVILEALREGRTRTVGLGRANDRYFTFCAGLGLDAGVINRVEQARRRGRTSRPTLYLKSTIAQYVTTEARRTPSITLELPGQPDDTGLAMAIVQNTAPWTYIGDRPIHCCPEASFDTGLDLLGVRQLGLATTAITASRMLGQGPKTTGKRVVHHHDVSAFTLRCASPLPFQVDGEYLGEREMLTFAAIPNALRIVC